MRCVQAVRNRLQMNKTKNALSMNRVIQTKIKNLPITPLIA
jgi:hypothetical protein